MEYFIYISRDINTFLCRRYLILFCHFPDSRSGLSWSHELIPLKLGYRIQKGLKSLKNLHYIKTTFVLNKTWVDICSTYYVLRFFFLISCCFCWIVKRPILLSNSYNGLQTLVLQLTQDIWVQYFCWDIHYTYQHLYLNTLYGKYFITTTT